MFPHSPGVRRVDEIKTQTDSGCRFCLVSGHLPRFDPPSPRKLKNAPKNAPFFMECTEAYDLFISSLELLKKTKSSEKYDL